MAVARKLKNATITLIAGFNIATILIMSLTAYADHFQPQAHPVAAVLGLGLPVMLTANLCFLVLWLIVRWRWVLLPIVGYVICFPAIRVYMPLNPATTTPQDGLKVLSYNVFCFGPASEPHDSTNAIAKFLVDQRADLACLQEVMTDGRWDAIQKTLKPTYQYIDTVWHSKAGGDCLALLSRWPILRRERIGYNSQGNLSVAWTVSVRGREVIVVNNHFESNRITSEEKDEFKQMLKGDLNKDSTRSESRSLLRRLASAAKLRAPEVDSVSAYLRRHAGESIILCGDFNDNPISYTRRQLASQLTDCYVSSGFGPGVSYHQGGMYVRIDNIMCSADWEPYEAEVFNRISTSDHYPIYCWLKKRVKIKK